jgi:hypothetical protein
MTVLVEDKSIAGTTDWIPLNPDRNSPYSLQVVVPGAVTIDYTVEVLNQRRSDSITADEIAPITGLENLTQPLLTPITGPLTFIRLRVDSISGGTIMMFLSQSSPSLATDDEVG